MKLLIDMDVVVYRAGYAAKHGDYLMNIEYADNILYGIFSMFEDFEYQGYLSGKSNFRYEVAKILPYKGNRDPKNRPRYYKDIREYLVDTWGAKVTDGIEADDAMGIDQDEESVICSIDKDLKMIPGHHFNFVKNEMSTVTEEEGMYNFFRQMLIGDRSDNIPGINKIGEVKSARLLQELTPKEQLTVVQDLYEKQYGEAWEQVFDEIATLLWIQRKDAKTYKECRLLYD